MTDAEAIEICEGWFAYIERQRQKSAEVQKLATMARNGQQKEAQRRLRQLDNDVTVYDGSRLEPAVRALVKSARGEHICARCYLRSAPVIKDDPNAPTDPEPIF